MRKEKSDQIGEYIRELRTIKRELIESERNFLIIKKWEYELANGRRIKREELIKNKSTGSAIIVAPRIEESGEFLVVIEPRVFTSLGVAVSFPAGYIEKGESAKKAAVRELREETGYVARSLVHLDSFYQDEGVSAAFNHSFLALDAVKRYPQSLDDSEIVRYITLTLEEIEECEKMVLVSGVNSKLTLWKLKDYMKGEM